MTRSSSSSRVVPGARARYCCPVDEASREPELPASFSGFLSQTQHALGVLDTSGRVLSLNPAAERLLGCSQSRQLGKCIWDLARSKDSPKFREQLESAVRRALLGESVTVSAELDRDDARPHVDFSFAPFRNDADAITGVLFEGIDVTARVRAQAALAESERRYRAIFDTNPAVKLIIEPKTGRILDGNASAVQFYGLPLEELRRRRIQEINTLPEADVQLEMKRAQTEERLFFNFKHRVAGGAVRDVEVYSGPIEVDGEKLLHSIIIDVTDRGRLEERLARSERMEAIGQLAGGVAHDFNNILTVLLGYVELAMHSLPDDAPAAEHVREIGNATRRASDLTQGLLSLARKNISQQQKANLGEIVLHTDRFLRRLIGEQVELVAVVEPDLPLVEINTGRFEQALLNLVINARDAIVDRGRITIVVEHLQDVVINSARPGAVRIAVTDTGAGIADVDLPRIFDPLFTTKEAQGGTGFGLATCKSIVEAAGGSVSVNTQLGVGTTFSILLPTSESVEPETQLAARQEVRNVSATVLLAEDEPSVRRLVASSMRRAGLNVVEAENGDVALRIFTEDPTRFHLLVTDVVMPLLGGPELARRVAQLRSDLPILFVSGYPADLDPRVLDNERRDFLAKPFTTPALLQAVDALLPQDIADENGAASR